MPTPAERGELRPDGLYQCVECDQTYDSEASLVFCCNPAALRSVGAARSDRD
jgi:hypothetical protein